MCAERVRTWHGNRSHEEASRLWIYARLPQRLEQCFPDAQRLHCLAAQCSQPVHAISGSLKLGVTTTPKLHPRKCPRHQAPSTRARKMPPITTTTMLGVLVDLNLFYPEALRVDVQELRRWELGPNCGCRSSRVSPFTSPIL